MSTASKRISVLSPTPDCLASFWADHPSAARAALIWTPVIICFYVPIVAFYMPHRALLMPHKNIMTLKQNKPSRRPQNWQKAISRLEGAYSPNTLRCYSCDFGAFYDWCRKSGRRPLPASPQAVAEFVAHEAPKLAPSTLRRRLAGIRKVHRLMRLPNPAEDEDVLLAMRRALRTKPRRPKQAYGLTKKLRDKLIAACPNDLVGIRNRALIAVAVRVIAPGVIAHGGICFAEIQSKVAFNLVRPLPLTAGFRNMRNFFRS